MTTRTLARAGWVMLGTLLGAVATLAGEYFALVGIVRRRLM